MARGSVVAPVLPGTTRRVAFEILEGRLKRQRSGLSKFTHSVIVGATFIAGLAASTGPIVAALASLEPIARRQIQLRFRGE